MASVSIARMTWPYGIGVHYDTDQKAPVRKEVVKEKASRDMGVVSEGIFEEGETRVVRVKTRRVGAKPGDYGSSTGIVAYSTKSPGPSSRFDSRKYNILKSPDQTTRRGCNNSPANSSVGAKRRARRYPNPIRLPTGSPKTETSQQPKSELSSKPTSNHAEQRNIVQSRQFSSDNSTKPPPYPTSKKVPRVYDLRSIDISKHYHYTFHSPFRQIPVPSSNQQVRTERGAQQMNCCIDDSDIIRSVNTTLSRYTAVSPTLYTTPTSPMFHRLDLLLRNNNSNIK